MTSWLDAIRYEWLLQRRTLRFRAAMVAYTLLTPLAAVAVFLFIRPHLTSPPGLGTYLVPVFDTQRYLTGLLAVALAGNRLDSRSLGEMWPVLAASPITNLGFVLRRTVAVVVLALPVTMIPPAIATAMTVAAGQPLGDPWTPVVGWALYIVPVLCLMVALWTGLVLIAGGELAGIGLYFLGSWAAESLLGKVRELGGPTLEIDADWLGIHDLIETVNLFGMLISRPERTNFYQRFTATDGPLDIAISIEWLGTRIALAAGIAVFLLLVAPRFLRRTRRDLRPLVLRPDHPLRNIIRYVHAFRQRQASDGALHHERWAAWVGVVVLLGAFAGMVGREATFRGWVDDRYAAEMAGETLPVTPPGLRIERWSVTGVFDERGHFDTSHDGTLSNHGDESASTLALLLNPFLQIETISVVGHSLQVDRAWDRVTLTFDPPLAPRASAAVEMRLTGQPAHPHFAMHGWSANDSFARRFRAMKAKAWPTRRNNLSISRRQKVISRRRVEISAGDLVPAPRYASWALTPPPDSRLAPGLEVPPETFLPTTDLTVELSLPEGWLLADVCGSMSRSGRLDGSCHTPLARYAIEGGLFERFGDTGATVAVAALPEHLEAARQHLETFEAVIRLSGEAWPGVPPIERLAVIERLPPFHPANLRGWSRRDPEAQARGLLLRVPEALLVQGTPLRTENLVGEMLTNSVTGRRLFESEESRHLQRIFEALMARRMGVASPSGASVGETPFNGYWLKVPILHSYPRNDTIQKMRLPAVVAALEGRLGRRMLFAGAEAFLAADTEARGTIRELFDHLEERSGVDLDRFYEDHFLTGVVPDLRIEDVRVDETRGGRFRITGSLRNQGTGEVECPIVARAEAQAISTRVRVGSDAATLFELELDREPHTLLLDPEITCYRLRNRLSDKVERLVLRRPT